MITWVCLLTWSFMKLYILWSKPGVLWFMGSQRVRHDWATELNWKFYEVTYSGFIYFSEFVIFIKNVSPPNCNFTLKNWNDFIVFWILEHTVQISHVLLLNLNNKHVQWRIIYRVVFCFSLLSIFKKGNGLQACIKYFKYFFYVIPWY